MKVSNYRKMMKSAYVGIIGALFLGIAACNDVMEDSLRYNYPESGSSYDSGHVLLVVMDGASGKAVQAARNAYKTPNLKSMIAHALYTDYGLGDGSNNIAAGEMTNARGWANLMIGNTTHNIKSDDELVDGTENMVSRLVKSKTRVSMYAASEKFRQVFSVDGMTVPQVDTDESVKDALLDELKLPDTSDLIVAEFKGVYESAGENFYDEKGTPTKEVINAIGELDGYIGEIWNALKERPAFVQENWLIIVTSNYGGNIQLKEGETPDDHYGDATRNTFTLMYNERLLSQVQTTPGNTALSYSYSTPVWAYDNRYPNPTAYAESARLGNKEFGELRFNEKNEIEPMTIQFFLRSTMEKNGSKYVILSKSTDMVRNGWMLYFNQDNSNRRICFTIGSKRGAIQTKGEENWDWTQWHVITLTLEPNPDPKKTSQVLMNFYFDGELNNSVSQKNSDVIKWYASNNTTSADAPLRMGGSDNRDSQNSQTNTKGQTYKNTMFITNVQFYDMALPAEDIKLYAGKNQLHLLQDSYKYWDNLKGYWPCDLEDDQMEPVLKNYAKDNSEDDVDDFVIDRGASNIWLSGSSLAAAIHPIPESDKTFYNKTFNTVDISRQVFIWLGKSVNWDWSMEGKAWKFAYEEFSDENN